MKQHNRMMKYNRYFVAAMLGLLTLSWSGCEDSVVNLTPQSELTEANYFKQANQINDAVVGIYSHYQSKLPNDWHLKEFPTDHLHISTYRFITGLNAVGELAFEPSNPIFSSFWQNNYNGIYRANSVLANLDNPQDYQGSEKQQYEGEAKFMRALYYFDLVRAFGGVPEVTSKISVNESMEIPRSSEEEIYSLIISDLEQAIELLPRPENTDLGRANKGAAAALLGKVYVYRENYSEALNYLESVADYGFQLEENYADLFTIEGSGDNDEFIFQMNYIENIEGNPLSSDFVPYDGAAGITSSGGEVALLSWSVHKLFEEEDSRKDVTVNEYWAHPSSPDQEEWYPFVGKYAVPHPPNSSGLDLPVLRYGDTVLLMAEANYFEGNITQALENLNSIRERAFGDASHNYTLADISTEEQFMDKLMLERQLELAFENQRWFDLVRTGRFMEALQEHERNYNPETGQATTVTYDVQPHQARFPIPQHEINQANPGVLEQNEGY
ncbi:RagB/SusD family nutrient uptake outer membrane protein [Fodinibius sediminis]|uniref:RagB/SusD domain-containing protein n=1 Tax=Fodinibius sediminis TaxID=1214077 RepID=A0A521CTJ6_9BACT|nr:RagB/SusD family nutrient uptake outer membrane protein [Fodinibius sediminis]SMO62708.1 RagB/SusD domain-containing protein [Fodinibius sediminis]